MKECTACSRCYPDQVNHCPSDGQLLKQTLQGDTVLDGRYQLEKRLGQGGMGAVFKARHIFLKTQHAIKIILPDLVGNDPSLTTRFRQEAMAAAAIQHPNTVSVTDYGIINDTMPFLVMELIEGRSLHDILLVEGKLAPERALEIMLAVSAGVAAAHRQEIVHRDLKPLNVLIKHDQAPADGVKVLDFGLAKIKSGELLGSFVVAQTQGMMGSPYYMAPEQWGDEDIDRRADIYSLGVILYQMLAGEVPFKGNSVPSIMNKHLSTPPVPFSQRGIDVPSELEHAVQHALAKDVCERPQTVDEFVEELRHALVAVKVATPTPAGEIGLHTVQIPPGDTLGGLPKPDTAPEAPPPSLVVPGVVTGAEANAETGIGAEDGRKPAVSPLTIGDAGSPSSESLPSDGTPGRGVETASHRVDSTAYQPGAFDEDVLKTKRGDAPTALLDTENEARLRAELERQHDADEVFARARREEEERFEQAERERQEAEQRQRLEESERAAESAGAVYEQPGTREEAVLPAAPSRSKAVLLVVVAVALLFVLGGVGVLAYLTLPKIIAALSGGNANTNLNTNASTNGNANSDANVNSNANLTPSPTPVVIEADLVPVSGGAFRVGRTEVPPISDQYPREQLLWLYSQWPAHPVTIRPFQIDRTEVTNAEYAAFVEKTGHPAPPGWGGDYPKPGEGILPVSSVSFEDAQAFAAWRSQRDSATYRLPTEEEWEYAASGGDASRPYPWGTDWASGRANLNSDAAKPVGSYPAGRTPEGVDDMLGNVWEWTSSMAAMYKGNNRTQVDPKDKGKMVVRGGSYKSTHDGDEPITVTSRRWVDRRLRDPVLGFRLVRVSR